MMRSVRSRHINTMLVAGFVALVYASLAAMAASCALGHVDASMIHAHHGSQEAVPHNALCAWACQATSDAGLASEPPALSTSPAVQLVFSSLNHEISPLSPAPLCSRAPPSMPFVLIG
jgi:hypothetical protein